MSLLSTLAALSVLLIALLHIYIMILEMFLWTTPRALKAFGLPRDLAQKTTVLAANQGLYNGFLAVGLLWGLVHPEEAVGRQVQLFFLGCVFVAGVFGAATAKPRILFVQSVPALGALGLVLSA